MASTPMSAAQLLLVAEQFKVLAEPARLGILQALLRGERAVGELQLATGLGQANLSKHLRHLHAAGFVTRRKDGIFVHYAIADARVFELCDLMCAKLQSQLSAQHVTLAG